MMKTIRIVSMTSYKPSPRECAMLFLKLVEERDARRDKAMTRAQLSEGSLKRLWKRERFSERFLEEVHDWLLSAGWALFYAGGVYGAVKTDAVGNWPTLASSRIKSVLDSVALGKFKFEELEYLLSAGDSAATADENEDADEEIEDDLT
jgi:hypothetical protein